MRDRRRPAAGGGGSLRWLALAVLLLSASRALAVCKEPLADTRLHALDALAVADPVSAVREARAVLDAADFGPAHRAQLFAILADAHNTTGEDDAALLAVREARTLLDADRGFAGADRVRLRLDLVAADAAHSRDELLAAVQRLNQWQTAARGQPIGWACLLLVRSRVLGRAGLHDQAAQDGLEALAAANRANAPDAVSEAHFQLANTFRRAGLFERALTHADASVSLTRARRQAAALSNALYAKSQILSEARRFTEAARVMGESREISRQLGDRLSVAFADQYLCLFDLETGQPASGRRRCQDARRAFQEAQREDMVAVTDEQLARIDLAQDRPRAALARLQPLLRADSPLLSPVNLAQAYRTLAGVQVRLGQPAAAVAALQRVLETDEGTELRQRSLAAALTLAEHERRDQDRREAALNQEVQLRREQAQHAAQSRRRAWALLAASGLVIVLLGALLAASRRHARVLRRQEALLRAASDHSPDALLLVTSEGRVQFASRAPFGDGVLPAPNQLLLDSVPPALRETVREVLAQLLEEGVAVERDLRAEVAGEGGGWRDLELRASPILQGTQVIGATLRTSDVTARRSVERAALELSERLRERAGGGLHEGLAQELAGVSLQLGALAAAHRRGESVEVEAIEASIAQLSSAIVTARELATGLSPLVADRGSLPDALARFAADFSRQQGGSVRYLGAWRELPDMPRAAEPLYRMAELAIVSSVAPGQARHATLQLEPRTDALDLLIESDGGRRALEQSTLSLVRHLAGLLGAGVHFAPLGADGWRLRVGVPRSGM